MSDANADAALFRGEYVVEPGYAEGAASALFSYNLTRPRRWIPIVVIVALASIAGVALLGNLWWIVTLGGVIGGLVTFPITFGRLRRRFEVIAPTGGEFHLTLGETVYDISAPMGATNAPYTSFDAVAQRSSFVFLRHRGARIYSVLPAQLFTPESLAYLREKIGQPTKA